MIYTSGAPIQVPLPNKESSPPHDLICQGPPPWTASYRTLSAAPHNIHASASTDPYPGQFPRLVTSLPIPKPPPVFLNPPWALYPSLLLPPFLLYSLLYPHSTFFIITSLRLAPSPLLVFYSFFARIFFFVCFSFGLLPPVSSSPPPRPSI